MPKNTPAIIERLFVMLLAGSCTFMVAYLRDINQSMSTVRDRVGTACEQVSAIEVSVKALGERISYYQVILDNHETRLDNLTTKRGG